jgi:hypothetical protein
MGAIVYDKTVHQWLLSTNYPLIGGARFSWADIKYFCLHYIGAGSYAGKNEAAILNSIQKDYVENRGYSFGYSSAIGLSGTSYEGRGEVYRAASNGDSIDKDDELDGNPGLLDNLEVFSCLLIIGTEDEITPEMIKEVNSFYTQMPPGVEICGHFDLDHTPCPGSRAYAMIYDGTFHRNEIIILPPPSTVRNVVIDKFTILDPPDRFYDSRDYDDKQPLGPGTTKFGIKRYDGINIPRAVEVTVTAIPQRMDQGDGYLGVNERDSFINWKASDIGRPMPQTVWLPVDDQGEISLYSQDTVHVALSCRAYG